MKLKVAPLPTSFMVASIVGVIISANIMSAYPSWGFAFMFVFVLMLVASLISMTYAPIEEEKK